MINISKPQISKDEIDEVVDTLKSGYIVQGPRVAKLEKQFREKFQAKYAYAVNNGTSALHTAIVAAGIKANDEVITTPFTFIATANSILMAGAVPVFVDIDPDTYNINPDLIESAITKKTKAIIAVDLYGQPADYDKINKIAKKHKLKVIEDAAQSIFATYKGKYTGNLADFGTFSLYATKNIMSGEGGMVTTNSKSAADIIGLFRQHGQDEKNRYHYKMLGYNYRMSDLHAAIATKQMEKGKTITQKRQQIAKKYDLAFGKIKGIITPKTRQDRTHVYHQYTLRFTKDYKYTRDEVQKKLLKKDIQTNIYYPVPLYEFDHLVFKKIDKSKFAVTEEVSKQVLSIPVHPGLNDKEVKHIIDSIVSL